MLTIKRKGNGFEVRAAGLAQLKTTAKTPEEAATAVLHYYSGPDHVLYVDGCPFCSDMRKENVGRNLWDGERFAGSNPVGSTNSHGDLARE